jgi:hypothetical protein
MWARTCMSGMMKSGSYMPSDCVRRKNQNMPARAHVYGEGTRHCALGMVARGTMYNVRCTMYAVAKARSAAAGRRLPNGRAGGAAGGGGGWREAWWGMERRGGRSGVRTE